MGKSKMTNGGHICQQVSKKNPNIGLAGDPMRRNCLLTDVWMDVRMDIRREAGQSPCGISSTYGIVIIVISTLRVKVTRLKGHVQNVI